MARRTSTLSNGLDLTFMIIWSPFVLGTDTTLTPDTPLSEAISLLLRFSTMSTSPRSNDAMLVPADGTILMSTCLKNGAGCQ